jgi:hypothetical protein
MESNLSNFPDFSPTKKFSAKDAVICLDENLNHMAIAYKDNAYRFKFADIIESEIIKDNESITKTSRGSQLGGALVGSALGGGVGAIIGGLSGSHSTNTLIKSLSLKIVVDDLNRPFYSVNFMSNNDQKSNHPLVKQAIDDVTHWHSTVSVIINRNIKTVSEG